MSDPDDDDPRARLAWIARTLGVPMATFFERSTGDEACPEGTREAQERELISLFRALHDPQERRRCLDLVRALVKGSEGD